MFFRKRKLDKVDKGSDNKKEIVQNAEEISERIEILINDLKNSNEDSKLNIMKEIAKGYSEIGKLDEAIDYYERCLGYPSSLGSVHSDLLKLYNAKMRIVAKNKDNKAVQEYLDKIDKLMKITKDTIRGMN